MVCSQKRGRVFSYQRYLAILSKGTHAEPVFGHIVVHRSGADYACIEPVAHVANGFNLASQAVLGTGTRLLDPGESLGGSISFVVERA